MNAKTEDIKSKLSIFDVLDHYRVKKASNRLYYCPIHEIGTKHKPSLMVANNTVKCMSPKYDCFHGNADVFGVIATKEKLNINSDFVAILKKACEILGMEYGLRHKLGLYDQIVQNQNSRNTQKPANFSANPLEKKHILYLESRGISIETAQEFSLKSRGEYILFPQICESQCKGYKGISIKKSEDGVSKIFFDKFATTPFWFEPKFYKNRHLIFLEGEKDYLRLYEELKRANMLEHYTLITTTHGAGSLPSSTKKLVERLTPTQISIFYDKDDAGSQGALKMAHYLSEFFQEIGVYSFPENKKNKYDVSDFLNDGNTIDDLWNLNKIIVKFSDNFNNPVGSSFLLKELVGAPPKENWLIEDFILSNKLACVIANGGVGKSWFLLQLAISIAGGKDFLKLKNPNPPTPVLYVSGEEDRDDIHRRTHAIKKSYRGDDIQQECNSNLSFVCVNGQDAVIARHTRMHELIKDFAKKNKGGLIILDPFIRFFNGDENNSTAVTRFIEILEDIVLSGTTLIFSHHTNKLLSTESSQNAARGSSAIIDATRWALVMHKISKSELNKYEFENHSSLNPDEIDNFINVEIVKCNSFCPKRKYFTLKRSIWGTLDIHQNTITLK